MSTDAALASIQRDLDDAVSQTRLAYQFPGESYAYSAMQACLAARHAFAAYRDTLGNVAASQPAAEGVVNG